MKFIDYIVSGLTCPEAIIIYISTICVLLIESSLTDVDRVDDKGPSILVINTANHDDSSSSGTGSETEGEDKKKEEEEEEDDKVNNGFVKVETKAVPTPQHPTKVMCSPQRIQLPLTHHHDDNNNALSDDGSTGAELGNNPDERSVLSDRTEQPEALAAVNLTDIEVEIKPTSSTDPVMVVSPPEEDDDCGTPKGVVVLPSSVDVTSTISVVRPRSAPQSKLRRVLPADSDNCFTNYETPPVMSRHQNQMSVPDVVNPPKKDMHKYASLPAKSRYLDVERAMEGFDGSHGFTVLNSFKDSREAIDEIWKSVTLGRSSQLERTDEIASSSSATSHHSSSSLAVNASDADVSYVIVHHLNINCLLKKQLSNAVANGDLSTSPNASKGVL